MEGEEKERGTYTKKVLFKCRLEASGLTSCSSFCSSVILQLKALQPWGGWRDCVISHKEDDGCLNPTTSNDYGISRKHQFLWALVVEMKNSQNKLRILFKSKTQLLRFSPRITGTTMLHFFLLPSLESFNFLARSKARCYLVKHIQANKDAMVHLSSCSKMRKNRSLLLSVIFPCDFGIFILQCNTTSMAFTLRWEHRCLQAQRKKLHHLYQIIYHHPSYRT